MFIIFLYNLTWREKNKTVITKLTCTFSPKAKIETFFDTRGTNIILVLGGHVKKIVEIFAQLIIFNLKLMVCR